jgi:hypothetical protein
VKASSSAGWKGSLAALFGVFEMGVAMYSGVFARIYRVTKGMGKRHPMVLGRTWAPGQPNPGDDQEDLVDE